MTDGRLCRSSLVSVSFICIRRYSRSPPVVNFCFLCVLWCVALVLIKVWRDDECVFVSDRTWAQINPLSQRTERLTASIWDTHTFNTFNLSAFTVHSSAELCHKHIYRGHVTHMRKWHHKTCFLRDAVIRRRSRPEGESTRPLLIASRWTGSWTSHMRSAARERFKRWTALTCGFIQRREREGVYRVLNLDGDAFLPQRVQHVWIQTFSTSSRPQNQNLCKNTISYCELELGQAESEL